MKLTVYLLSLCFTLGAFAQSVQLVDTTSEVLVEPQVNPTELIFGVKNISNDTVYFIAAKEVIFDVSGTSNYFCWDVCLPPAQDTAGVVMIKPGETSLNFKGDYKHNSLQGRTKVKYTFFNRDSVADKVSIEITYINEHIAGDADNNGFIDGTEICGDVNNNGAIDAGELLGDIDGNGIIDHGERTGDKNGDKLITDSEVYGDSDNDGIADNYTGIAGIKTEQFKLSPNPVQEIFTINYELSNANNVFTVFDILGNKIMTKELTEISGSRSFNVSKLNKGIYFYTVSTPAGKLIKTEKFIISK